MDKEFAHLGRDDDSFENELSVSTDVKWQYLFFYRFSPLWFTAV